MATNKSPFKYNMFSGTTEPLVRLGLFQAGVTAAVKQGELLEKTVTGNTIWTPMDSDYDMSFATDAVAVAFEEIKSGDRAGYYHLIVPRPGDVFEFAFSNADNPAEGTAVYWSDSQTVTSTAGSYILGHTIGQDHYPIQSHLADDASPDAGVTLRNTSFVQITIELSNSVYAFLQQA